MSIRDNSTEELGVYEYYFWWTEEEEEKWTELEGIYDLHDKNIISTFLELTQVEREI